MIVEEKIDGRQRLVVTHPFSDKLAVTVLIGASLWLAVNLVSSRRFCFGVTGIFIVLLLLAPFVVALMVFTMKIRINKEFIEIRGLLRDKKINIPQDVQVEKDGSLLWLRAPDVGFEYSFPNYLMHGTELERKLENFFENPDDSP